MLPCHCISKAALSSPIAQSLLLNESLLLVPQSSREQPHKASSIVFIWNLPGGAFTPPHPPPTQNLSGMPLNAFQLSIVSTTAADAFVSPLHTVYFPPGRPAAAQISSNAEATRDASLPDELGEGSSSSGFSP